MAISKVCSRGMLIPDGAYARATAGGAVAGREPAMVTGVGDPRRRSVPLAGRRGCRTRVALRQRKRPAPVTLVGSDYVPHVVRRLNESRLPMAITAPYFFAKCGLFDPHLALNGGLYVVN